MRGNGDVRFAGSVDNYRTRRCSRGKGGRCHCVSIVDGLGRLVSLGKGIDEKLIQVHITDDNRRAKASPSR